MKNNRRLYLPYLLTGMMMVMMYYIVVFLSKNPILNEVGGGDPMRTMLELGSGVLRIFVLIFLFYANSFLIRRRKKEFGLYNILGMGKGNLARVQFWESLITAVLALTGGLLFGVIFSKLAELVMVNIMRADVGYTFSLSIGAIRSTAQWFAVVYLLIFFNTLWQVRCSNPVELLHSESAGEKPPKANWVLAATGMLILAAAYFMALKIEDPISALVWFFVAVMMVIAATYLIFIAGSVALCRILQKRKGYYYKASHFVSVSSMSYRMKRNGAGLASICILSTIVLVMLSSTVCLYVGEEDVLAKRCPREVNLNLTFPGGEFQAQENFQAEKQLQEIREQVGEIAAKCGDSVTNILSYQGIAIAGILTNGQFQTDTFAMANVYSNTEAWQLFVFPLEDYNRIMGQQETLAAGEALVYTTKRDYKEDTLSLGEQTFHIVKRVPEFAANATDSIQIFPSLFLFVSDFEAVDTVYEELTAQIGRSVEEEYRDTGEDIGELKKTFAPEYCLFYGFDTDDSEEKQAQIKEQIQEFLQNKPLTMSWHCDLRTVESDDFYGLYGGLFFLGILLGIVFLFAAVLIMYYNQIYEGYEDQSRYEIMRKVGMTKRDIRKSINSQMLTVFLLPLLMSGLHLAFAFPFVQKMLLMFGLTDTRLLIMGAGVCYLIYALFYMVVYRITSRAYYTIVS